MACVPLSATQEIDLSNIEQQGFVRFPVPKGAVLEVPAPANPFDLPCGVQAGPIRIVLPQGTNVEIPIDHKLGNAIAESANKLLLPAPPATSSTPLTMISQAATLEPPSPCFSLQPLQTSCVEVAQPVSPVVVETQIPVTLPTPAPVTICSPVTATAVETTIPPLPEARLPTWSPSFSVPQPSFLDMVSSELPSPCYNVAKPAEPAHHSPMYPVVHHSYTVSQNFISCQQPSTLSPFTSYSYPVRQGTSYGLPQFPTASYSMPMNVLPTYQPQPQYITTTTQSAPTTFPTQAVQSQPAQPAQAWSPSPAPISLTPIPPAFTSSTPEPAFQPPSLPTQIPLEQPLVIPPPVVRPGESPATPSGTASPSAPIPALTMAVRAKDLVVDTVRTFSLFDSTGKGSLDLTEFTAAMRYLGTSASLAEAQDIFNQIDLTKRGTVTEQEFLAWYFHNYSVVQSWIQDRKPEGVSPLVSAAISLTPQPISLTPQPISLTPVPLAADAAQTSIPLPSQLSYVVQTSVPPVPEQPVTYPPVPTQQDADRHVEIQSQPYVIGGMETLQAAQQETLPLAAPQDPPQDAAPATEPSSVSVAASATSVSTPVTSVQTAEPITLPDYSTNAASSTPGATAADATPNVAAEAADITTPSPEKVNQLVMDSMKTFRLFDTDSKGCLDIYEFTAAMRYLGVGNSFKEAQAAFEEIDTAQRAIIDEEQFLVWYAKNFSLIQTSNDPKKRASAIFAKFDAKQAGVLTMDDFIKAMGELGLRYSAAAAQHVFDALDPAQGGIDEANFVQQYYEQWTEHNQ